MSTLKIMFIGLLFVIGWVIGYLFIRQIIFNYKVALPVLKNMKAAKEDLIVYENAKKYTTVSTITCIFVILLISAVVVLLYRIWNAFDLPLLIAYLAGLVLCGVILISQISLEVKTIFESFCKAYYRFVPDDQLRTDMYNCKVPSMKLRCHDMEVSTDWIPSFKKEN